MAYIPTQTGEHSLECTELVINRRRNIQFDKLDGSWNRERQDNHDTKG